MGWAGLGHDAHPMMCLRTTGRRVEDDGRPVASRMDQDRSEWSTGGDGCVTGCAVHDGRMHECANATSDERRASKRAASQGSGMDASAVHGTTGNGHGDGRA